LVKVEHLKLKIVVLKNITLIMILTENHL